MPSLFARVIPPPIVQQQQRNASPTGPTTANNLNKAKNNVWECSNKQLVKEVFKFTQNGHSTNGPTVHCVASSEIWSEYSHNLASTYLRPTICCVRRERWTSSLVSVPCGLDSRAACWLAGWWWKRLFLPGAGSTTSFAPIVALFSSSSLSSLLLLLLSSSVSFVGYYGR